MNTLNELASALGNDVNFAATITAELANKVNTSSLALVATSGNINSLTDVDTITNAPVVGESLVWNGTNWAPGASVSAVLADASLDGGGY